jgi:DeoR/GlpR family transcriptional regulator of sugar metabolism
VGAEVAKKVVASSESIFLVADSSKINNRGFAFIQSLDKISAIITDNKFPQKEINAFRKSNLSVIIA